MYGERSRAQMREDSRNVLVLAFFTVVASSPNLSTFLVCGCKGTTKSEK